MNKQKIRQYAAVLLIVFLVFLFALTIYFGLKGNIGATISLISFNTFFTVVLFFLIKLNKYVKTDFSEEEKKQD